MRSLAPFRNRILHADCLDVLRQLPENSIDLILTDPPYGINYQSKTTKKQKKIRNDDRIFIWWLYDAYRVLKPGGAMICFVHFKTQHAFFQAIQWAGFELRQQLVWDKIIYGPGYCLGDFAPRHETAWYAVKGRFKFWFMERDEITIKRPHTVSRIQKPMHVPGRRTLRHPTEKSVELFAQYITYCCPPEGIVLDPFGGSCTTAEAAFLKNRDYIVIEIDQDNIEIGRQRIREFQLKRET